jgi:hypothetical protein
MISKFFNDLAEYLQSELTWLDRVGSNVTLLKKDNIFIPISCFNDECKNSNYLIPNNGISNILFFEFNSTSKSLKDPCTEINRLNFDLFFWFNCEKLDINVNGSDIDCCEKSDYLYSEILRVINKTNNVVINGVNYNINAGYLNDRTRYFPYFNFKINMTGTTVANPCENNNLEIQIKQC